MDLLGRSVGLLRVLLASDSLLEVGVMHALIIMWRENPLEQVWALKRTP